MSEITQLLAAAETAARAAGALLMGGSASVVTNLERDVKIDADRRAHDALREALEPTGIPVLSEEDEAHNFGQELMWVADPLDGSVNYLRGIPLCAVSIALMRAGEPVLGVVYDFNRDELFAGAVGQEAQLNGEKVSVSSIVQKSEAIIATGFPAGANFSAAALERSVTVVQSFKKVRLLGSAALSLAWVACGRADAYHEDGIRIWDVAAGLALVKAAGGVCSLSAIDAEGKCTVSAATVPTLLL